MPLDLLTHDQYQANRKVDPAYYGFGIGRWAYYKVAIDMIQAQGFEGPVLELGAHGFPIVNGADVMQLNQLVGGTMVRFLQDARANIPWPIADKQYGLFVALQVWEHLDGCQAKVFQEVKRVAKAAVLSFPYKWNFYDQDHQGIDEVVIARWTCNEPPVAVVHAGIRVIYAFNFEGPKHESR